MNTALNIRRSGMTLIEIMIAILILSIGLLGVLAAIPFGAMQMGRMIEKDYVSNLGRNAFNVIRTSHWDNPNSYYLAYTEGVGPLDNINRLNQENLDLDTGALQFDFTFPCLLDPLGFTETGTGAAAHLLRSDLEGSRLTETGIDLYLSDYLMQYVFPVVLPEDALNADDAYNASRLSWDWLCRTNDDLVFDREENSSRRPDMVIESDGSPAFTGEYSWLAMMTPTAIDADNPYDAMEFPTESNPDVSVNMRVDSVIFRGRVPGFGSGAEVLQADLQGSGYAGGVFRLRLLNSNFTFADVLNVLQGSTHLLLLGPSDSGGQYFARWYRIANYSNRFTVDNDLGDYLSLTVIGENCPSCWTKKNASGAAIDEAVNVRAILFQNVRGVFTRTTSVTAN